jgi:hypothetical protein
MVVSEGIASPPHPSKLPPLSGEVLASPCSDGGDDEDQPHRGTRGNGSGGPGRKPAARLKGPWTSILGLVKKGDPADLTGVS